MRPKVTVIDYGMGNLYSVSRAVEYCGGQVVFASNVETILNADRVLLPGVGAFADGMNELINLRLVEAIREYCRTNRPFLGICLGMQMMMDSSEEFGFHEGLGIISGSVVGIPKTALSGELHKIPHIGWNELQQTECKPLWDHTILNQIPQNSNTYFVHSYTVVPESIEARLADTYYNGRQISAVIRRGNLYGCQFHPEKSGTIGLRIIKNFLEI